MNEAGRHSSDVDRQGAELPRFACLGEYIERIKMDARRFIDRLQPRFFINDRFLKSLNFFMGTEETK